MGEVYISFDEQTREHWAFRLSYLSNHPIVTFINPLDLCVSMQQRITLQSLAATVRHLQRQLQEVKALLIHASNSEVDRTDRELPVLADERLLAESWLSDEDEAAFSYLQ